MQVDVQRNGGFNYGGGKFGRTKVCRPTLKRYRQINFSQNKKGKLLVWYRNAMKMNEEKVIMYQHVGRRKRGKPIKAWKKGHRETVKAKWPSEEDWNYGGEWHLRCRIEKLGVLWPQQRERN